MATKVRRAGGRANEAGAALQAAVGAWFAAHLVARAPVGARFGLHVEAFPISLRFETGSGLDDIEVTLSDGGLIAIQGKTNPNLSPSATSDLAQTLGQVVAFIAATPGQILQKSVAVMAVRPTASARLNGLHEACRMFDLGGAWQTVYQQVNATQREALDIFRSHVSLARSASALPATSDADLEHAARHFRIERFDGEQGAADWREAAGILGARVYGDEALGVGPLESLRSIARTLIGSGAVANREGLLQRLRNLGHEDSRSPYFDLDLQTLRTRTQSELVRLERHSRLPLAGGIPLARHCLPELSRVADEGSFLVIGEPGAGKTGVLVELAKQRQRAGLPTMVLSVDDLAGIGSTDALRVALGLQNGLMETLAAWPGSARGVLFVDALDATRGGPGEAVFAKLIEDAHATLGERWSVVASIRTFDLRNSKRFREAMAGDAPSSEYADPANCTVRHFLVPALSEQELSDVAAQEGRLLELLAFAPPQVRLLLRNIFNLSLAAALMEGGTSAASIRSIATQSDLIDRYEDERLQSSDQEAAVEHAISVMVTRRMFVLRKVDIAHRGLDETLRTGVLVPNGDRVAFAHHVLFDHVAGRYYLDWNDTSNLVRQLSGGDGVGLLLGPALRFAIERVWREDDAAKTKSWRLIAALATTLGVDPVVSNIALRCGVELLSQPSEVQGLCSLLRDTRQAASMQRLLSRMSRLVRLRLTRSQTDHEAVARAWALVAQTAASTGRIEYVDGIRILLVTLLDSNQFHDEPFNALFGQAARALLTLAWTNDPPLQGLAPIAIRAITRSFASAPAASRRLLEQALAEPRFTEHAHEECPWLAEGVLHIAASDPSFAVSVYEVLYGMEAPSQGESWMGGQPSRLLGLISNRPQDYNHGRWHLQRSIAHFLTLSPAYGTRAVSVAAIGIGAHRYGAPVNRAVRAISTDQSTTRIVEDGLSFVAWRASETTDRPLREDTLLAHFAKYLSSCSDEDFRTCAEALVGQASSASAWARLFGVACERRGVADDLLWPVATSLAVWLTSDTQRDSASFVALAYGTQSFEEKINFERLLVERANLANEDKSGVRRWAGRLLSELAVDAVLTPELMELRKQLSDEDRLGGNRPYMQMSRISSGPVADVTEYVLARQGVDLAAPSEQRVVAALKGLAEVKRQTVEEDSAQVLADLWSRARSVLDLVDSSNPPPHEATLQSVRSEVSIAAERIAGASAFDPLFPGLPSPPELIAQLDRLAADPYPPLRGDRASMSQDDWDLHVFVASALMSLLPRWGSANPGLVEKAISLLMDPSPPVRSQIAGSLNVLWDIDRPRMWSLMRLVARIESDISVMTYFVGGALQSAAHGDPDLGEELLGYVTGRFAPQDPANTPYARDLEEAIGRLTVGLHVGQGKACAGAYIHAWLEDVAASNCRLWEVLSSLRGALFGSYQEQAAEGTSARQRRAMEVLLKVIRGSRAALASAVAAFNDAAPESTERAKAKSVAQAACRLLEHGCDQLYFGSGAFKGQNETEPPGLPTVESKRAFLADYEVVLDEIAGSGEPSAVHHLLEVYEFLAEGAPGLVFDKLAAMLIGPAALEGYQYESLGGTAVVRMVKTYLADYRSVFEDRARREALMSLLELFSDAGLPDALLLLDELPDLLR